MLKNGHTEHSVCVCVSHSFRDILTKLGILFPSPMWCNLAECGDYNPAHLCDFSVIQDSASTAGMNRNLWLGKKLSIQLQIASQSNNASEMLPASFRVFPLLHYLSMLPTTPPPSLEFVLPSSLLEESVVYKNKPYLGCVKGIPA